MAFHSPLKSRCSWPVMAYSVQGCELAWKSPLSVRLLATENNAEFIEKVKQNWEIVNNNSSRLTTLRSRKIGAEHPIRVQKLHSGRKQLTLSVGQG